MTIKPGYGLPQLHLKQPVDSLKSFFGSPQKRRRISELREYWLYPDYGFDCIVSKRSHRVLSIFLNRDQHVAPIEEMAWRESAVRKAFSEPQDTGGGFLVGSMLVDRWYGYESGIGFHFDTEGRVKIVSIFAAKAVRKAKLTVRPRRHGSVQQMAALRQ